MNKKSDKENSVFIPLVTPEKEKRMLRSTSGNSKIWNYFIDLLDNKRFGGIIDAIRKNLVDEKGLPTETKRFNMAVKNLCRTFGLDEIKWSEDLENYILKKELPKENLNTSCLVLDRIEIGEDEYPNGYYEDEDGYENESKIKEPVELEAWSYSYPVIIRVNPYASQREIIDFIKKSYKRYIEPIQQKYQDEDVFINKIRKKKPKIKNRNQFIYEHRHLPRKEIMRLVTETLDETLDYGHIGKIISLEKKKRENK